MVKETMMQKMVNKFRQERKPILEYNIRPNHKLILADINYNEINTWIHDLMPGQNVIIRFYDYNTENYVMEDACITIKAYSNLIYRKFSLKVFYMNSKENVIHPMMVESMGHSYELKYNDESIRCGMGWGIRNAIENVLHMCYTNIYDYSVTPAVVIDDTVPNKMEEAVDKFIYKVRDSHESPHIYVFRAKSARYTYVMVNICPSYANITVAYCRNGTTINYPLFPVPVERKALVSYPEPVFKLVDMIFTRAYTVGGLYRRRYNTQYALSHLLPGIGDVYHKVETNPETEEIPFDDYTAKSMAMKFTTRLQNIASPFLTNQFRYEYAFNTHADHQKGYTMKIGALIFKDYAVIYAFETDNMRNITTAVYSKVISPTISDWFDSDFIPEQSKATSIGISTKMIVDEVGEYVEKWMMEAKYLYNMMK